MDLVTLTDHDSIGAAESLRGHADFFLSEEATCRMPSGTTVHIGVFDITERQHLEIQRRRDDFVCLLAVRPALERPRQCLARAAGGLHGLVRKPSCGGLRMAVARALLGYIERATCD